MKEIIQGFYQKKHFWTRLILVIAAVILMGFALSWLLLVDLGTDPCTLLNQTISTRLGISIGNWQALFNTVLLIFVIIFGGRNLGFGTLANMFLVGYSIDFFSWIWAKVLPADLFTSMGVRIAVLIPALILFILAASFYMDVDMGTAPYDAVSFIISTHLPNVSFRVIRIVYDFVVTAIAVLLGGKLGTRISEVDMFETNHTVFDFHFSRIFCSFNRGLGLNDFVNSSGSMDTTFSFLN